MDYNPRLASSGTKRTVTAGDLDDVTLNAGNEVTVYSNQVKQDKVAWWGHGPRNRQHGSATFVYANIVDDAAGAVEGELIAAITDSDQRRVLASTTVDDLGELADAADSERTERIMFPALEPYARPGRHIELRILADDASDGASIDPAGSDVRLYYSEN